MKFTKKEIKDIKPLKEHKKLKRAYITFKVSFWFSLSCFAIYGIYSFFSQFSLQSPILLQSPIKRIEHKILNPVASPSAKIDIIPQTYAGELSPKDLLEQETNKEFGSGHWKAMETLVQGESGFNPYSVNKSSGACGMFQFLPCSKMPCNLDNVKCQIKAGFEYIKNRYGDPTKAYAFWVGNSPHWY